MYAHKMKGLAFAFVVILAGCSHKVTTSTGSYTRSHDAESSVQPSTQSSTQSGTQSGTRSSIQPRIQPAYPKRYTMLVKAGSNTIVQSLNDNTGFDIYSNGVHIKGTFSHGALSMQIGNKKIQLDGKQLAHYTFSAPAVQITIRLR
jgi:hypothetical protein